MILSLIRLNFLYYKYHNKNLKCGGSYIDSLDWIKKQITPANDDEKCFQCCNSWITSKRHGKKFRKSKLMKSKWK